MELYAGFGKRLLAFIIDGLVLSVISGLAIAFGGWLILGWTLNTVVGWLYFSLMESSEYQATLGKLALGIIVTDLSGQRISFATATGRYFGKILSGIILCIGYIMAAFTEKRQALHDLMAGTLVINRNSSAINLPPNNLPPNNILPKMPVTKNVHPLLCGVTGNYAGQMIPVEEKGIIIGRDPLSCNLIIPSEAISRMHCIVKYDPAQNCFTLTDTCSSNGTFQASGVRVGNGQAIILRSSERFFLASKENMFEVRL